MAASALMLFVQLALIRWAGANLIHLSYFSNLILLASFLGIGLGFLRSRHPRDIGRYVPVGLLIIVLFITFFPATIEVGGKDLIFFTEVTPSGLPSWSPGWASCSSSSLARPPTTRSCTSRGTVKRFAIMSGVGMPRGAPSEDPSSPSWHQGRQ